MSDVIVCVLIILILYWSGMFGMFDQMYISFRYIRFYFFTYSIELDGPSVAESFYCDELCDAKSSGYLLLKVRLSNCPLLKMMSVAIYIQRRLY